MLKFVALWNIKDGVSEEAFEAWYRHTHIADARRIPGLRRYTVNRVADSVRGQSRFYRMAELTFDSHAAAAQALQTPEWAHAFRDAQPYITDHLRLQFESEEISLNSPAESNALFPDAAWFRRLAGFIESDEDFRAHCKWLTARIAFRCDQDTVVMAFDRGLVLDIAGGHGESDFLIAGSRDQWRYLFEVGWGLVRLHRSGTLTIRADPVRLMQNWKAIFFITEGMKKFARESKN